ncbi:MAG: hypothetical protein LC637_08275 [Xanthomonadaceae bacterium]|nr:hypothetical protein [Xanthomonadaceae bacterium]
MQPKLDIAASLKQPFAEGLRGWLAGALGAGFLIELISGSLPLGGLIGFILSFLVWLVLYRVASETLLITADGETVASASRFQASDGLAARHVGLWVIATLALAIPAIYFGTGGAILGSIAIAAVLPAATIVLTLSRSLVEALLPSQWVRLLLRIGYGDYGRLCGVLLAAALTLPGACRDTGLAWHRRADPEPVDAGLLERRGAGMVSSRRSGRSPASIRTRARRKQG